MPTVSIRGKDNLYKHFKNVNDPHWKLYNTSDAKTPIQVCLSVKQVGQSLEYLIDIVDSIDPNGTYILDTYSIADNRGEQRFLKPNTSICFSINENVVEKQESVSTTKKDYLEAPASLKEHLELVRDNAKLTVEVGMYKQYWEDAKIKIAKLENEIEELEEIIDEYEEEEEEAKAVSGDGSKPIPNDMNEALTQLVVEHGGAIVENLMGTGTKEKVDFGNDKDEGEIKVNGITSEIPSVGAIIDELHQRDPLLQKHLYKLLIIAREKPHTFKIFLKKLENF